MEAKEIIKRWTAGEVEAHRTMSSREYLLWRLNQTQKNRVIAPPWDAWAKFSHDPERRTNP